MNGSMKAIALANPRPSGSEKAKRLSPDVERSWHTVDMTVEIEKTVAIGFRSRQFQRKAAVGGDLFWHDDLLESVSTKFDQLGVAHKCCELRCLQHPAGSVIILRVTLFLPVFGRVHPI
jgi:hypothetical protein